MTDLGQRMLEELQRRNFSETTIKTYLRVVEDFARYFGKRPDRLNQHDIRKYQVHLLQERKLTVKTVRLHTAALRFFYVKTLHRRYLHEDLPYPKSPKRLPSVLSQDEVARLIDSTNNLLDYTMLMTLYATGMRRAELCRLKVQDIDSHRMVVHIHQGKGNRDRDVPLTPTRDRGPPRAARHRLQRLRRDHHPFQRNPRYKNPYIEREHSLRYSLATRR